MTSRQLAVSTLRHLTKSCLREQMRLKTIRVARSRIQQDEAATYRRIKGIKARIDRELIASAALLGIPKPPVD